MNAPPFYWKGRRRLLVAALLTAACAPAPLNGGLSFTGSTVAPPPPPDKDGSGGSGGSGGAVGAPADGRPIDDPPSPPLTDAAVEAPPDASQERVAATDLALARDGGGCQLVVSVTTQTRNSGYAPSNVGAIWIQDGAGKFVKSLAVWAAARMSHLNQWVMVTTAAGLRQNRVDAITSATKNSDGARMGYWNCTDANRQTVADGDYAACFELNEGNGASRFECVMINKGPVAEEWRPADSAAFKRRVLDFFP